MPAAPPLVALALLPLLGGCMVAQVAGSAIDAATLPVKAASAGLDALTTSQAEADQKRGREERRADEERGRAEAEAEQGAAPAR